MRNWDEAEEGCTADSDWEDMRQVCKTLDIKAHEVDLAKDYWNFVFDPFIESYQTGTLTPNPDVDCNRYIKFDTFVKYCVERLKVDLIATGHYARLVEEEEKEAEHRASISPVVEEGTDKERGLKKNRKVLLRARDELKDQTYFLATTQVRVLLLQLDSTQSDLLFLICT